MGGSADAELVALWVLQPVGHGPTVAGRRNHDGAKGEQPVPLAVRLLRTALQVDVAAVLGNLGLRDELEEQPGQTIGADGSDLPERETAICCVFQR